MFISSIPAIPGCHAEGKTQVEMLKNLDEVLELCLRNMNKKEILKTKFIGIQNRELSKGLLRKILNDVQLSIEEYKKLRK